MYNLIRNFMVYSNELWKLNIVKTISRFLSHTRVLITSHRVEFVDR